MEKYCGASRPHITIWRVHNACLITKAANTHSEYVILIAFPPLQWSHKRTSLLTLCAHWLSCHSSSPQHISPKDCYLSGITSQHTALFTVVTISTSGLKCGTFSNRLALLVLVLCLAQAVSHCPGFNPRPICVEFVVYGVSLGQISALALRSSPVHRAHLFITTAV